MKILILCIIFQFSKSDFNYDTFIGITDKTQLDLNLASIFKYFLKNQCLDDAQLGFFSIEFPEECDLASPYTRDFTRQLGQIERPPFDYFHIRQPRIDSTTYYTEQ